MKWQVLGLSFAVMFLVAQVGCNKTPQEPAGGETAHEHEEGHDHDHGDAPHGGQLLELGDEEYHAELLQDEKTNTVTVHLLDGPAKKSVAIAEPEITLQLFREGEFTKYSLKAVEGEDAAKEGTASEFKIVDESLTKALCRDEKTQGRLQVTIDGKPYTGTIKMSCHDHGDDHDDGHDDDDEHAGHDH